MAQVSVATQAGQVLVWGDDEAQRLDLATGNVVAKLAYPAQIDPRLGEFALSPDACWAVFGRQQSPVVVIWNLTSGEGRTISCEGGTVWQGISSDTSRVLGLSDQKLALAWNREGLEERARRRLVGHGSLITGAFSSDGQRILAVSYDKVSLFGFEQEGIKPLQRVASGGDSLAFSWGDLSADAAKALLVRANGDVCVWDLSGLHVLGTHTHEAHRCWITPDANYGVSVGWSQPVDAPFQQEIKVWDLDAGKELRCLNYETDPLIGVALTDDGNTLLLAHDGPRVEAFHVSLGEQSWASGEASIADYHPSEETGRSVLFSSREATGDELDRAGGDRVAGLAEWPRCPECSEPQTLLLRLAADPRKLPLDKHSGLAVFACLQGCVTHRVELLSGDATAQMPKGEGQADVLGLRALTFHASDDADDEQFDAPAKLGGAPEWPARTIPRQRCRCGETLTYRVQLQPGKDLWKSDLFDALGDFGWVFVCPRECSARVLFWSY